MKKFDTLLHHPGGESKMTITDWLKKQKELLAAATPGPWIYRSEEFFDGMTLVSREIIGPKHQEYNAPHDDEEGIQADIDCSFIASVRTEHERALMIIERYRNELSKLTGIIGYDNTDIATEALAYFPEVGDDSK